MIFKQRSVSKFLKIGLTGIALASLSACSAPAKTTTAVSMPVPPAAVPPAATPPPNGSTVNAAATLDPAGFQPWLASLRAEALQRGISARTLDAALPSIQLVPRAIELDRKQPEFSQTFGGYFQRALSPQRISAGKAALAKNRALLEKVAAHYGVQPEFLVAFWGMETNYGSNFGGFPVLNTLATLAYDQRRPAFFRRELLSALQILDRGDISLTQMQGSWAGAMGNLQFMPSTFLAHAVDGDGDGKRDIWGSLPDTFSSAAKYLSDEGWNGSQGWGREVRLPSGFDYSLADLSVRKPVNEWVRLGVKRATGQTFTATETSQAASLVLPAGAQGPAFLVYNNFRVIMMWNRSILYALAVSYLSDQFVDGPTLVVRPPADDTPLRRSDVEEMQTLLTRLGYDPGTVDGLAGGKTKDAIRAFQRHNNMIADAYPSMALLARLRQVSP